MVFRVLFLWCLDRVRDLLRLLSGTQLVGSDRIQPIPEVLMSFREGWWGELAPEEAAGLTGRWLAHSTVDAVLLFEPLPVAPSLELALQSAPPGLRVSDATRTPDGVTVVPGTSLAGPTWLLWHPAATMVVAGKWESPSPPFAVRRFIHSAKPLGN